MVVVAILRGVAKMDTCYDIFDLDKINLTKYLFFTGKGGVGKTSTACAVAVNLADRCKQVLLISTDPASNLQDVFNTQLNGTGVSIDGVPGLVVANLSPEEAAREYRESVVAPYRGKLPESVIANMEEQLSGSCTVEIAAFDQFSNFITDSVTENKYDYIIFDTAPTGHTLLLLDSTQSYHREVQRTKGETPVSIQRLLPRLRDDKQTEVVIVTLPEATPVFEAQRLCDDLSRAGINNKWWVVNQCLSMTHTKNTMLLARAEAEKQWLEKVRELSNNNFVAIPWLQDASIQNISKLQIGGE
jgi:arsenite/tail-anchored protein-transporting ATPase